MPLEDRTVPALFTVLNTNDTGAGSLRNAVAQANANVGADDIIFNTNPALGTDFNDATPDTITLTSGAITFAGDTALTTVTGFGGSLLSISGGNTQGVFWVNSGISAAISELTISGGNSGLGGGLYNEGTVSLANVAVTGNHSSTTGGNNGGGGIFNSGTAVLTNCIISGNTAAGNGGGIASTGYPSTTLVNCIVTGNTAGGSGGGFNAAGNGMTTITNTTISDNSAASSGGGLVLIGNLHGGTLVNVTISGNSATNGGGIHALSTNSTLIASTISGNTATANGGGIFSNAVSLTISNSTISNNTAAQGGGLFRTAGTLPISNTIVAGNSASSTGPDASGTVDSQGFNLVGKTDASTGWAGSDLTGTIAAPLDPVLAPLANNGGPTRTHALGAGSPAAGAGANAVLTASEIQTVAVFGVSGNFTLTFNGQTTGTLAHNASAATVESALNALTSIGGVGGSVTVDNALFGPDLYRITFGGTLANQNLPQTTVNVAGGLIATVATIAEGNTDQRGFALTGIRDIGAFEITAGSDVNRFIVTSIANSGAGTLRQAIIDANATAAAAGTDQILFNIPGAGIHTISPLTTFPAITQAVVIDGTTQSGWISSPIIELRGDSAGAGVDGLTITGAGTTIRGLVINRFDQAGILIEGTSATGNTITGNYIGTDATGMLDLGNTRDGVNVRFDAKNNTIGGITPGAGNLISGNDEHGVTLRNSGTTGNLVVGNLIGVNRNGTAALGNTLSGMTINVGATGNMIGGTTAGARNVISGNLGLGIHIIAAATTGNTILGNYIGTNASNAALGNVNSGILIDGNVSGNTIGGTAAGAGNVIAFNGQNGITLPGASAANNSFRQNSFFANTGLAIDVGNDGQTLNTPGTALNFPVLTSVRTGVGVIEVEGFAQPGRTIEFYIADSNAGGFSEGQTYLATAVEGSPADTDATAGSYGPGPVNGTVVGSDTANRFHFTIPVPADFVPGMDVTALTIGSVSEFGASANADLSQAFGAPVVDAGPDATLVVGQTFSGRGSFSDIDSDSWTAEVNYGDGSGWQPLALDPPVYAEENGDGFTVAATVGFALNHTYALPGDYVVVVRVTDDSGTMGSDALLVDVGNAPPVIDNSNIVVAPQRVAEGGTVTVNGTFSDASTGDSHTVRIIWGDGSDSLAFVNEAAGTFTASHVYADDNLPNTASEAYPLQGIITDGAGATATSTHGLFFVQVDNVQPSGLSLTTSATTVSEGGTILLSGSFTEPGVQDTHRVVIAWGDGSPDTIVNLPVGVTNFSDVAHQYLNNPAAPATSYTVRAAVADDDEPLGPAAAQTAIVVNNVVPSNVVVTPSSTDIVENDAITLSGSFTDPGSLDAHTVVINWGDGSPNKVLQLEPGATSFAGVTHRYLDNPTGNPIGAFPITVTVADADQPGTLAAGASAVTVRNANPTVVGLTLSSTSILEDGSVAISGTYADVGTLDTHTIAINWGDGTTTNATVDSATHTFTASHRYLDDNPSGTSSDVYTITATAIDDDTGSGGASLSLTVANVAPIARIVPGPNNIPGFVQLFAEVEDPGRLDTFTYAWTVTPVGGGTVTTAAGSSVTILTPGTSYTVTLTVTDDDTGATTQTIQVEVLTPNADTAVFTPSSLVPGVSQLMVLGLAGADSINASALAIPVVLDGGADADTLTGGSANDVVFLHQGNDSGFGGGGSDRYKLTPNSTLTVVDGFGNNTLDFGTSTFGITFDLSNSDGDLQNVQPTTNLHFVSINDLGTGQFGTLIGSEFGDDLTAASDSTLYGGDGSDLLQVKSGTTSTTLFGGADGDQLLASGTGITVIDFHGDDGADLLTNTGTVGTITFGGGSDGDEFLNNGTIATIDFRGDDGADLLTNDGTVTTINFGGGSDGDEFLNTGTVVTGIDFRGDDGSDLLTNTGSVGAITFGGGSDGDELQLSTGSVATTVVFSGDDGADLLTNTGTIGTITFGGGSDGDELLMNAGSVATTIVFNGDDGADALVNNGTVTTINFGGGSDGDQLLNNGANVTTISFNGDDGADTLTNTGSVGTITFGGGSDGDQLQNAGTVATTIDFQGDDGADTLTNTGSVGTITFGGGSDGDVLQMNTNSVATAIDFQGDDGADMLLNAGSVATITFTGGSDGDLLQNNGTGVTSIDFQGDDGADTLTNVGSVGTITFGGGSDGDVLQTTSTSVVSAIDFQGDDGADTLTNTGSVGTITFGGGSDGDVLQNSGTVATSIDFQGDDGADTLTNVGAAGTITFGGGSDGDLLQTSASSAATTIDFHGDDGADTLVNNGSVATITFTGGSDADRFGNFASGVNAVTFIGDDGADLLVNGGNNVGTIMFTGGSDGDAFLNTGTTVTTIDFQGDDGADVLQNNGSAATITFGGGSDGDEFLNNGTGVTAISFQGDDGADVLVNNGNGNAASTITFAGGSDGDAFQNNASLVGHIDFQGDDGADVFHNNGSGVATITFTGGSDGDYLQNTGASVASINFQGDDGADTLLSTGANVTSIDFTGDDGVDTLVNTGTGVASISFTGGSDGDELQNRGTLVTHIDFQGDDGADTLTNTGSVGTITFGGGSDGDLLQTSGTSAATTIDFQGDDGADALVNFGAASTITFGGGSDGDYLQNSGPVSTTIDFHGDDGADTLVNFGTSNVASITFTGGSDGDAFWNLGTGLVRATVHGDDGADTLVNDGSVAATIDFRGDDGADVFTNNGSVATITFTGGSDGDLLQNTGTVVTTIDYQGDDGADTLTNAGTVATITFAGGSDGDELQTTTGSAAITIDFQGDDGADVLVNAGSAGTITFTGGSDGDLLQNGGTFTTSIDFHGDDGADTLIDSGTGAAATTIVFNGGADDDLYIKRGHNGLNTFNAGPGDDRVLLSGSGNVTLAGGAGSDSYSFAGSQQGSVTIVDNYAAGDSSADTLDFAELSMGGVNVDLTRTTVQTVAGGLSLTLSDSRGIENVVGTAFADNLIGNNQNNLLDGAALRDDRVTAGPGWDGQTQWVYLDFDTETEGEEHVYTQAERDAIQARIAADYHGPDAQNPWFHVNVTQNLNDIPSVLRDVEQYATLYFNRTPNFNRPGGEASELDFRNVNLGGDASIQVNGLTGGEFQPQTTSANIIALASKIGAHELAHLMGVRHADAFGPIGYGLHSPPGNDTFKPNFGGAEGAFETFSHLIGSPATIGSDRFNDLNDLYFGEREAVKLSFAERGTVMAEQGSGHGTIGSAQLLTLATLTVPTTVQGLHAGSTFDVAALAVTGSIALAGARSESDFYSFTGRRGDILSIEVVSIGLAQHAGGTIDSVLRLYDPAGNLVPYHGGLAVNDDQFEPTDSLLFDVMLPADGTYYIEVDTFARNPNDPVYDPQNPTSPLNPDNTASVLNPLNPNFDAERLAAFLDARDDTDTGDYELFLYRFTTANPVDANDSIQGGAGDDTIRGGMGGDSMQGGPGNDVIDAGDGVEFPIPADVTVNAGDPVSTVITTAGSQTVSWQAYQDGSTTPVATGNSGNVLFTPDDNGDYTVNYTVAGSLGDTSSDTFKVTTVNVAPTVTMTAPTTIAVGVAASFTVSASDVFAVERAAGFTYTIAWGDGQTDVVAPTANNGTGVTLTHTYTATGNYSIAVTATDKDNATGSTSQAVSVVFGAPTATITGAPSSAPEGVAITLVSTVSNPGGLPLTYVWQAFKNGASTRFATGNAASFTFTPDDNGTFAVSLTVSSAAGSDADGVTITTTNVVPVVSILGPVGGVRGQELAFTLSTVDAAADLAAGLDFVVDFGDGSAPQLITGGATVPVSHVYVTEGNFTITVTATDKDLATSAAATRTVTIEVMQIQTDADGKQVLVIGGTTDAEKITVMFRDGFAGNELTVKIKEHETHVRIRQRVNAADVERIRIFAQAGNDDVRIENDVTSNTEVFGGVGNDRIRGGSSHDILVGGDGDDLIMGGEGRDILIGGFGRDHLLGDASDDILIAGVTTHDDNVLALQAIQLEWTSGRSYSTRVANLYGTGTGDRANGATFLDDATVFDDGERDILTGGTGFDWFIYNSDGGANDNATDLQRSETGSDIDLFEGTWLG